MNRHLKISIIAGVIAILLFTLLIEVNAQGGITEQLEILTEIRIDIKYIKNNINEIKNDNKSIKEHIEILEDRVTRTEERQISIKEEICNVTERNSWFSGLIGSVLILILGLQIKRNMNHRKNNGETDN